MQNLCRIVQMDPLWIKLAWHPGTNQIVGIFIWGIIQDKSSSTLLWIIVYMDGIKRKQRTVL